MLDRKATSLKLHRRRVDSPACTRVSEARRCVRGTRSSPGARVSDTCSTRRTAGRENLCTRGSTERTDVAGWRAEREGELARAPGEEGPKYRYTWSRPRRNTYLPTYLVRSLSFSRYLVFSFPPTCSTASPPFIPQTPPNPPRRAGSRELYRWKSTPWCTP